MSKQMRLMIAGSAILAVALLVWALMLRAPVSVPPPAITDEVSTFAQPGARGGSHTAQGRSARADAAARARRGESNGSTVTGGATETITPPIDRGPARVAGSTAAAPLEVVTVEPTYDASDAEVTPPALLSPLVPKPSAQPRTDAPPGAVRILVNENGTVESAKATVDPRTMSEAILITSALQKVATWRFQPATRNGKPVRYSLLIPLNRF